MRVLITGAAGMLARALHAELARRGHDVVALDRRKLDVTDPAAVGETVAALRPDVVFQGAAFTSVDGSEAREEYARLVNADSTRTLARACARAHARLVYPSTDFVFDGSSRRPYLPTDPPRPLGAYGRTKLLGERAAAEADDWLVVRVAWLYGPERAGFIRSMIERARRVAAGELPGPLRIVTDEVGRPTWTRTAAAAIAQLIETAAANGIHHVTGSGDPISRFGLVREAVRLAGLDPSMVEPTTSAEFGAPAPRPQYSALDLAATEAVIGPLPDWRDDLRRAIVGEAY